MNIALLQCYRYFLRFHAELILDREQRCILVHYPTRVGNECLPNAAPLTVDKLLLTYGLFKIIQ